MQYELTLLADHLTSIRPLLGSVPDLGLGLMAWEDDMVLVTDAAGECVGGNRVLLTRSVRVEGPGGG